MHPVEDESRSNAGLASELRVSVMRLRRRLTAERSPENELSTATMAVLGCLHRHGESSVGELARHERVQPPSMTRTVKHLEEGGYVMRRRHETDGRLVLVELTEKGRETLHADRASRDAWLARRLDRLSPAERASLCAAAPVLQRIAEGD